MPSNHNRFSDLRCFIDIWGEVGSEPTFFSDDLVTRTLCKECYWTNTSNIAEKGEL